MIKTITGKTIDYESLSEQLNDRLNNEISVSSDFQIHCYQQDDWLIIFLTPQPTEVIDDCLTLIKDIINENEIISDFMIGNNQQVYFANQDDYPSDIINHQSEESLTVEKKYSSANFSSGLIIFILSVLSIASIGIFYFISRPCTMAGKCELMRATNASVSQTLKNKSQADLTKPEIDQLKTELTTAIQTLNRIPRWSDYHQEARQLITQYQNIMGELNYFLEADKLVENADNMSKKLPLSIDEWNRVKTFLENAIEQLNLVSTSEFTSEKQERINNYQSRISLINTRVETEKIGKDKLFAAQAIIQEIEKNKLSVNSVPELEKLEEQWQTVIKEIESIPVETTSAKNKTDLLNSYLSEIINIQGRLVVEKEAINLFNLAQENIKLAKESEDKNQLTQAITFWQKAVDSLEKISPDSFIPEDVITLQNDIKQKVEIAKVSMAEALQAQKIEEELKTICLATENICSYKVDKKKIDIFLTPTYFQKIVSLYNLSNTDNNVNKKQQLLQHIEQVENNYQYLTNKYNLPVQIYNYNNFYI